MAKTSVKKKICDACGADVRPGSLFCYNCGGAVSGKRSETAKNNNRKDAGSAGFQKDPTENADLQAAHNDLKTTPLKKETVDKAEPKPFEKPFEKPIERPVEKPFGSELFGKIEPKPIEKPSVREEAKLKSAANMRRKAKSFQRKRVEVVWEEPENAPNKWFPIVAILLILFVAGIFYLAMYLK